MNIRYCLWNKSMRNSIFLISIILLFDFFTVIVAGELTAVVNITSGPVQGEILLTAINSVEYAAFKGIRFAKAPVGYLRFQPPLAVDPWTETLNATAEGDECPQLDDANTVKGAEDCLFINVYTPVTNLEEIPSELKAVMAYFYGGGFSTGSSSTKIYRPDYLLERDVVFVASNYRLGPLGFLAIDHPNATGNAGLKDQTLSLKWIQANIEKFGGNPNNVTIFGESAGSVSVGLHILSDSSVGLFHGSISMSGVPLNPWAFQTPEKAFSQAKNLGTFIGSPTTDAESLLKALYEASATELVKATTALRKVFPPFRPTIEDGRIATDVFLAKCPFDKYVSGNFSQVPQIIGFMNQETLIVCGSISKFLIQVMGDALIAADEFDLNSFKIANGTTDMFFIAQIDQTQRVLTAAKNKPVYYYHCSFYTNRSLHNIAWNSSLYGAGHADDLAYIFYVPSANYSTNPDSPVARTANWVSTMWTNFAKYGNPTPNWIHDDYLNVIWPDSGSSGRSLNIGNELTIGPRPINENTRLIELLTWPKLAKVTGCPSGSVQEKFRFILSLFSLYLQFLFTSSLISIDILFLNTKSLQKQ